MRWLPLYFLRYAYKPRMFKNKKVILPIILFLFGIWFFCLQILGIGLEFVPGDLGDSRFINYLLEHGHQWVQGNSNSFWNAQFMYPLENTIAISDNMLGTMPIYSLFRSIGFSIETSYQLWWIAICSLNYWVAYFVIFKWFKRWDLAILVAWIFAFTIFNLGQLDYMQMTIRFMVPIVIYAAAKMVETKNVKYFALYSLGVVFQFYSVIYTGFFLFYFSFAFLVIYAIVKKDLLFFLTFFNKTNLLKTLIISVLSIGAMLLLIRPYLGITEMVGLRTYAEIKDNLPTLTSYLYPNEASRTWSFLNTYMKPNVSNWWLHYNFIGMIPLLGLISIPFFWIYWKVKSKRISKLTWAISITTFLIFLWFTRTESGYSLYISIIKLPGMNSIRVMNRFIHVALFMLLVSMVSALYKRRRKWSYLLFLLVFLDNSFTPQRVQRKEKSFLENRRIRTINLIEKKITSNHTSFAIINNQEEAHITHIDAMMASLELGIPTINGYSSSCPAEFGTFFNENNNEGLNLWLQFNKLDRKDVLIIQK